MQCVGTPHGCEHHRVWQALAHRLEQAARFARLGLADQPYYDAALIADRLGELAANSARLRTRHKTQQMLPVVRSRLLKQPRCRLVHPTRSRVQRADRGRLELQDIRKTVIALPPEPDHRHDDHDRARHTGEQPARRHQRDHADHDAHHAKHHHCRRAPQIHTARR